MSGSTKAIKNFVDLINRDYLIKADDGAELKIFADPGINGWQIYLTRPACMGGGVAVVLTQHEAVPARIAVLILKMLYHDILGRTLVYKYYSISRRDQ